MLKLDLLISKALFGLLVLFIQVFNLKFSEKRLPEGKLKNQLLDAIEKARNLQPLKNVLEVIGLSSARYHAWRRAQIKCELDDRPSCPKSQPMRLIAQEVRPHAEIKMIALIKTSIISNS